MIIFLNGPSSSGKTSLAKAIQKISEKLFLHIGIDTFIDMMPQEYFGDGPKAEYGFSICTKFEDGFPKTRIHKGPYGEQISKTIPYVIKLLADFEHHVILDEVLLDTNHYGDILKDHEVYYIGVTCDLKIMENREKERGNRCLGMARVQAETVHQSIKKYDLMIDTTHESPQELAKKILMFVKDNRSW